MDCVELVVLLRQLGCHAHERWGDWICHCRDSCGALRRSLPTLCLASQEASEWFLGIRVGLDREGPGTILQFPSSGDGKQTNRNQSTILLLARKNNQLYDRS